MKFQKLLVQISAELFPITSLSEACDLSRREGLAPININTLGSRWRLFRRLSGNRQVDLALEFHCESRIALHSV